MRILITGGAGFIGSHVAEAYLALNHEVAVVDNLESGFRENLPPGAEFFECDVTDEHSLGTICAQFRPEVVSHHAAQIDVVASLENPALDAQSNIVGSLNVWQAARDCGAKRLIFASSGGAIYGHGELPATEDSAETPLSPYGMSKLAFEKYLRLLQPLGGPIPVILRYSNVYGPRQGRGGEAGVVSVFARRLLNGQTCTIFGDGSMTRDYVFAGDVAKANIAALERGDGGIFNIASGVQTSTLELFHQMRDLSGQNASQPIHAPERAGEVRFSCLDASLARRELGWGPETSLSDGLREVLGQKGFVGGWT